MAKEEKPQPKTLEEALQVIDRLWSERLQDRKELAKLRRPGPRVIGIDLRNA